MPDTVAVLGGGVGGLTAAHELAERGFAVSVYESSARLRRQGAQLRRIRDRPRRTRRPARRARLSLLPRLLPPPTRHDGPHPRPARGRRTCRRARRRGEADDRARRDGADELHAPAHAPASIDDFAALTSFVFASTTQLGIPPRTRPSSSSGCSSLLTSCEERRFGEWELQTWWEFVDGRAPLEGLSEVPRRRPDAHARRGAGARDQRAHRRLHPAAAALRPRRAPAATPTACSTRRPARRGSIRGWRTCAALGVDAARAATAAAGIHAAQAGASRRDRRARRHAPDESPPTTTSRRCRSSSWSSSSARPLRDAEPRLAELHLLRTRWMNGVMLYLHDDVPVVNGHAIYMDSDWALTSISQRQFWPRVDFAAARRRHRRRRPVGRRLRLAARRRGAWASSASMCTRRRDQGRGVGAAQGAPQRRRARGARRTRTSPARSSTRTSPSRTRAGRSTPSRCSSTPPVRGPNRPDAVTRDPQPVPRLGLRAHEHRPRTMEGANEAARRAVNGILDATRSTAKRCALWKLREPALFAPARLLDRVRWRPAPPGQAAHPRHSRRPPRAGRAHGAARHTFGMMRRSPGGCGASASKSGRPADVVEQLAGRGARLVPPRRLVALVVGLPVSLTAPAPRW